MSADLEERLVLDRIARLEERLDERLDRIEAKISGAADERPAYTVASLATRLALSERTVRDMLARGVIASYRDGGARRVDPQDVDRYVADRRRAAQSPAGDN